MAKQSGKLSTTWPMPTVSSERDTPIMLKEISRPRPMISVLTVSGAVSIARASPLPRGRKRARP